MHRTASSRSYRVFVTVAALGLVIGAFGGFASGAIPNSTNGKIFGCYQTTGGSEMGELRLIDNQKNPPQKCTSKEIAISWNQQGSPGPNGYSTLIKQTSEAPGANCANGGIKIQSGLDNGAGGGTPNDGILQTGEVSATGYACNGAQGQPGVTTNCISFPHIEIDWHGCDLRGANLSAAGLGSANLSGANLDSANLNDADLQNADLSGANLFDASLGGANLFQANLSGADLRVANLTSANLSYANLNGTDLNSANLVAAEFVNADLSNADLNGANTHSTNFFGVTWSNTTCPDGTNSDSDGNTCSGHF